MLRVTVLQADRLQPARRAEPAGAVWWATTVGCGEAAVSTKRSRPYVLAVAGLGGLAARTDAGAPGKQVGTAEWRGGGAEITFAVAELPCWVRLYCFDELAEPAAADTGGSQLVSLARRYDGDAFMGVGEWQRPEGWAAAEVAVAATAWVGLEVVAVEVWTAEWTGPMADGSAGRLQVRVSWEPPLNEE